MSDPVAGVNGKNATKKNTDQTFLLKGHDSDSSVSSDDIVVVNNEGGSFQLHRRTLRETLEELKKYSGSYIKNLAHDQTESFKSVVEALRLLHGSQALYDIVLTDIRSVFGDVKTIIPGTVAAFFIGCFNDDKFNGPLGCSPKCAASLPPTENTPGYSNCENLVLLYINGEFSSLNEKESSFAYIHVLSSQFSGFSKENIDQLSQAGIQTAAIVYGNDDGTYQEITNPVTLDQLPQRADTPISKMQANAVTASPESSSASSSSSTNVAAIVFIVVIILIIILLLVILYRSYVRT